MNFPTQTQGTQGEARVKFLEFCRQLIKIRDRGQWTQAMTDKCKKFFADNESNDGRRYGSIFRNFAYQCNNDGGEMATKAIKLFLGLIGECGVNEVNRFFIISRLFMLFNTEAMSSDFAIELTNVFRDEVKKLPLDWQQQLSERCIDAVKEGEITNYRSVRLCVWVSSLTGRQAGDEFLLKILTNCSKDCVPAIVEVVRDQNSTSVFRKFTSHFLKHGFSRTDSSNQRLAFAKITSFLRNFTDSEVADVILAFSEAWASKDSTFFCDAETEMSEFAVVLRRHPAVGRATVKFFKKNKKFLRTSVFALMTLFMLASIQRFEMDVTQLLASSLSKIWKFADDFKNDGWIRDVINDLRLHKIISLFKMVQIVLQDSPPLCPHLVRGVVLLGLHLVEVNGRHTAFRVVDGRVDDPRNSVVFFGRDIVVNAIAVAGESVVPCLRMVVDFLCPRLSMHVVAFVIIDALIELRSKIGSEFIIHWDVFSRLTANVSELPPEVGVKIMAALMPVINGRANMRKEIFMALKERMVSPSKVGSALPVMLLLLRSFLDQPDAKKAFQYSQSFATFSSQLTPAPAQAPSSLSETIQVLECVKRCLHQSAACKIHVYKGILNICKKNTYFVIHGLDLFATELKSLPRLAITAYVEKLTDGPRLRLPVAHLVKSTSALLDVAIYQLYTNADNLPPGSQLGTNGLHVANSVTEDLKNFLDQVLTLDLEDIALDAISDFLMTTTVGVTTRVFAMMMADLYDVVVEHLWTEQAFDGEAASASDIEKLILRRSALFKLMDKHKAAKETSAMIRAAPPIALDDLQIDMPKLSSMLDSVEHQHLKDTMSTDGRCLRDVFIVWLMKRIHRVCKQLDAASTTCIASLSALKAMSSSLLKFYLDGDDAPDPEMIHTRTQALESFSFIVLYVLSKYEARSTDLLNTIYKVLIGPDADESALTLSVQGSGDLTTEQLVGAPPPTQADNPRDAGFSQAFRTATMKVLKVNFEEFLTAITALYGVFLARKAVNEYQRQVIAVLSVCRKLMSMLTVTSDRLRVNVLITMFDIAQKHDFGDRQVTLEFFRCITDFIAASNCEPHWTDRLSSLVEDVVRVADSAEPGESMFKSITRPIAPYYVAVHCDGLSQLFVKVSKAVNMKLEMGDAFDDKFLLAMCQALFTFSTIVSSLLDIDKEVTKMEIVWTNFVKMLTDMYDALDAVVKRFNVLATSKVDDIDEYESLEALSDLVGGPVSEIVGKSQFSMTGCDDVDTSTDKAIVRAVKKAQRDEKLFVNFERKFESFHVALLMLEGKYGTEKRPLVIPNATKIRTRGFKINVQDVEHALGITGDVTSEA